MARLAYQMRGGVCFCRRLAAKYSGLYVPCSLDFGGCLDFKEDIGRKMDNTYILKMSHITKTFPGVKALRDGCLRLKKGEIHALIGENGAGKSTLMKILLGDYPADSGKIQYKGEKVAFANANQAIRAGICMIPQEINMVNTMDAAENVWLGREAQFAHMGLISKKERYEATQQLFERMNISLNPKALVQEFSAAKKQMLAIAKAISLNSELIIMDEPTSSLSESEVQMLFTVMRDLQKKGVTIVFISHKIEEIFTICQTITVLRDGMFISEHAADAIDKDALITQIAGRKIEDLYPPKRKTFGDVVLEVKNFNMQGRFRDISFFARSGEILGIYGLVGAGRSETARAIFGIDVHDSGEVYISGEKVKIHHPKDAISKGISMVTEDRLTSGIVALLSVNENMSLANLPAYCNSLKFVRNKKAMSEVAEMIGKLNVKISSPEQPISSLSGGNQQKAILGKWMLTEPKILILDEPTRGIDVGAKAEIYALISKLAAQGMAVVLISSELPETLGMSDRIITFCEGKITAELVGEDINQERVIQAAFGFAENTGVDK